MRFIGLPFVAAMASCLAISVASAAAPPSEPTTTQAGHDMAHNPLLSASKLPYELPPFQQIADADFTPAFETGMAEQLRQVRRITENAQAPTIDNTILALERSGATLNRVSSVFFNLDASNTDDTLQKIEQVMSPKLAAHEDAIQLDPVLFKRVSAVHADRQHLHLDAESRQLLERYYIGMVRAGAKLSPAEQTKLKQMNQELASLATQFRQNVLKATADSALVVDTVQELDGLSPSQISAATAAAKERGLTDKFVITLRNTTVQPALTNLTNRALRERIYRASIARATSGATDNRPVIAKIIRLRAERARLLGYATAAAYVLEDDTAKTPQAVNRILGNLAPVAAASARSEAADIQLVIDQEAAVNHTPTFQLQAWDWDFYAEKVRKARYAFDEAAVKPYFEMDRVLKDGVFYAAHELYGLTFRERHDLPTYRDDVRVFEVFDADGTPLGLFLADYFARDNKQGGAWMNTYVDQSRLLNEKAVVVNNLNLEKPAAGQPVLLTFDEVTTMFHEFGHGIHGLLSQVHYPSLSGIHVPPDFGEYPSQYNEMWAREPVVLAHYARHYQTGAAMPKELFDKVVAAQKFNQGFATTSYLAAAMLDQSWHQIGVAQAPAADQVMAFEADALKAAGLDLPAVPVRYHSPYFMHIFSDGYDAGYYAYLWSEVLARDTGQWFHTHGGMTRANGDILRAKILSRGRTEEPSELFRQFYGREPDIEPLLEYRGLSH